MKVYADGGWEVKFEGLRVDDELFTKDDLIARLWDVTLPGMRRNLSPSTLSP